MTEHLAPPELDAPARLTDDQAEQLVLRTVATQAESLLRTAYRHSLCDDDAHDAYQRGLEIFVRRAPTLDPARADRWLHVVIKREAWAVRESRADVAASADFDADGHEAIHLPSPEERMMDAERVTRAAEALQRLKPRELHAMWLKASGSSYAEIGKALGASPRQVNRSLAEGRKAFLERFAGIEAGTECERWLPVMSAIVDGEAAPEQMADARPHLRNCSACRATLRGLHEADRPLAAVLPLGWAAAGAKLSGIFERLMAMGASTDVPAAAGGFSVLGVSGAKLAGVLAAGAVATGAGVAVHERRAADPKPPPVVAKKVPATRNVSAIQREVTSSPARASTRPAKPSRTRTANARRRLVARRSTTAAKTARVEFTPAGAEPARTTAPAPVRGAVERTAAPAAAPTTSTHTADSSKGEFAPQP